MAELEGKIAVVTGGASGIGRAAALRLAAAGAVVVIGDLERRGAEESCALVAQGGGTAHAIPLDVADADSVEAFFGTVAERFGRCDVAVNNAGVAGAPMGFTEIDEKSFDRLIAVNLKGVWLCMQAELRMMDSRGGGAIVNMASALGLIGSAGSAAYVASKHGVVGLTRAAAVEFSARGVRVNAVCPGVIRTPLMDAANLPPEAIEQLTALHPIGRLGTPAEVAEAILWLASPAASFVTGACHTVDGGWTAW